MRTVVRSPLTRRALHKPRGYAGDAVLIDLIYRLGRDRTGALSEAGRAIYEWELNSPGCKSVRNRCQVVTRYLTELTQSGGRPRVMSVACGHLREVAGCVGDIRRLPCELFTAIDQDSQSLSEVRRCYQSFGVSTLHANIYRLMRSRHSFVDYDFIYASGLYDYLDDRTARSLTGSLFRMLRSGGRLLIGNFTPDMHDIGYMESVMDWWLIYRTEEQMQGLTENLDIRRVADLRLFRDSNKNIIFLELRHA